MYIYFKLDVIKCKNRLGETTYIFNDKLYNKFLVIIVTSVIIKILKICLNKLYLKKPLSFLYRDYKLSKVINNENEKPE